MVGRDLSKSRAVVRHLQAKETGEVSTWSDKVPRFTGYSTAHRAPWLVSVGFPTEVASAGIIDPARAGPAVQPCGDRRRLDHRLDAVGPHHPSAAAARAGRRDPRLRGAQPPHLDRRAERIRPARRGVQSDGVVDGAPPQRTDRAHRRSAARQEHARRRHRRIAGRDRLLGPRSPDVRVESRRRGHVRLHRGGGARPARSRWSPPSSTTNRSSSTGAPAPARSFRRSRPPASARTGRLVEVRLAAAPVFAEDGRVRGVAFVHEDITARKRAEEQLRQFAHFDQLTGLANRHAMRDAAREPARRRRPPGQHRAARPRRLQGGQRHARPLDRRSPARCSSPTA